MKQVRALDELKELVGQGSHDYHIVLNGGLRSSKYIEFSDEGFFILNLIDDTEQVLSEADLFDHAKTNIGKAMEKGAFYLDGSNFERSNENEKLQTR